MRLRSRSRLRRLLLWIVAILVLGPIALIAAYAVVPPLLTPLMVMRFVDGAGLQKTWVPLRAVSVNVPKAVIASEDNLFCTHSGFDWDSLQAAVVDYAEGGRLRGASTISMQTAKNVFLWPGRDFVRKGLEAYLTFWIERIWSKRRIMEVYLNIAEWGDGLYGIGAASRTYFGKSPAALTEREAALLAAVLPNPREWSPARPTPFIDERARVIAARIDQLGPMLACITKR